MEAGKRKRVLIVDDSSTMRQLLKLMIAKYVACEITEAADGQAALECLRNGSFDLVVTDVNMPRLDGIGLVEAIRQDLSSQVPIVMVTTKGGEEDRDRGLALGANSYLTKPINGVRMGHLIEALLA